VQFDTIANDGRANLPVCPNLTARQRSNAGETMGIRTRQNIAPLVLVEVWAGSAALPRSKSVGRRCSSAIRQTKPRSAALPWWCQVPPKNSGSFTKSGKSVFS